MTAVMVRLVAPEPKPLMFFLDNIEKVKQALEVEKRLVESARPEFKASELRASYLRTTMDQACRGDWDKLIGFEPFLHGC